MIVVTGATGHVGNVLVKRLVMMGEKVRIISHRKPPKEVFPKIDLEIVDGDITNYDSLISAFQGAEYVYHLAAKISIQGGEYDELYRINVEGTRNVMMAAKATGVKRVIYVSSIHALIEPAHGIKLVEAVPSKTDKVIGDYAKTKVLAYHEFELAVQNGLDAVAVFPSGIIGPFDYKPSQMGTMFKTFLSGATNYYIAGGYNYVDVRDVVNGLIAVKEKGRKGQGYILGGKYIDIKKLFKELKKMTGLHTKTIKIPNILAYIFGYFSEMIARIMKKTALLTPYAITALRSNSEVDLSKSVSELGYKSRSTTQTIEDIIKFFQGKEVSVE